MTLIADALSRSTALVDVYRKAAATSRPSVQLPQIGQALIDKTGASYTYGNSSAENYRYFRHWVYICVHAIADRVAGQPWEAFELLNASDNKNRTARYRKKVPLRMRHKAAPGQELEPILNHEVLDLLSRPNELQRKYEFLYFTIANLQLTGEAYWLAGRGDDDDREQLFAVPSSWMEWDAKEKIYWLKPHGTVRKTPVPPEFVARTYLPNPSDPTACYSPLRACIAAIRVDDHIQRSQSIAFERGIYPNVIVTVGNDPGTNRRPTLTGAQRRQYIRAIREIWSQSVNIGDPAILDGLVESVHKLHTSPQEMDWPASGEIVKKRIMQTYRVNPYIVGEVTGVNKAQAVVAEQAFYGNVVNPLIGSMSETATDFLGPRYETPARLILLLEDAKSEDPDYLLRVWSTLRRNDDVTQEEIRSELLGLPPLDEREDTSALLQGALASVVTLLQQVGAGQVTVEQAVSVLVHVMRVPEEDARAIIGTPPPPRPRLPMPLQLAPPGAVETIEEEEQPEEQAEELGYDDTEKTKSRRHKGEQPRVPAGSSDGGQFTSGGGGGSPAETNEAWRQSLSEGEKKAFAAYTNGYGYTKIRNCQNKGEGCDKKVKQVISDLDKSVKRGPKHEGEVYRGLSFRNDKERAEFVARVQRDGGMADKGFLSTSMDRKVAEKFAKGSDRSQRGVVLQIKSKSGVDISKLSSIDEKEVLMPSKTKLKFAGMKKGAGDKIYLMMEES